jgi:hypothetical protein
MMKTPRDFHINETTNLIRKREVQQTDLMNWKDNGKLVLKETLWAGVDWVHWIQEPALMNGQKYYGYLNNC